MYDCVRVYLCVSLSVVVVIVFVVVFPSFDGSETFIKINIIGFALHPTNVVVFPGVLRFSHSSPGMFGIGSLFPFLRSDPKFYFFFLFLFFLMNPYSKAQHAFSLSPPPPPPPPPSPHLCLSLFCSISVLCHIIFITSHRLHVIVMPTIFQAPNRL